MDPNNQPAKTGSEDILQQSVVNTVRQIPGNQQKVTK